MRKNTAEETLRKLSDSLDLIEEYRRRLAKFGIELVIQKKGEVMNKEIEAMRFLTVSEVAKKLRISEITTYRYLQGGFLPGIKIGNQGWRIEVGELKKFLEDHHRQRQKKGTQNKYWTTKEPEKDEESEEGYEKEET